jgi:serine protease AprX
MIESMPSQRGLSWDHKTGRTTALVAAIALVASMLVMAAPTQLEGTTELIVREVDPASNTAERLVERIGGVVDRNLPLIGGFTASVPISMADVISADPSVSSAVPNAALQLSGSGWTDATGVDPNPNSYDGSVNRVSSAILQAGDYWSDGYTGASVDVALIDSGVVPVNGLTWPGKVINGPDLSFESQSEDFQYLDTFGHGTHMAGIIAGRDDGAPIGSNHDFMGVAPDARIVSLKVAGHDGATDVSQVIAAIDWVVQHRSDNGLNIRVLNLSFGTDSLQPYVFDPLAHAVEQAWKAGIVVVVAAGNDGNDGLLRNPSSHPSVIAVGATNIGATRPKINSVMDFSNCGTDYRHVDVVVPGESIASLAAPGSRAYDENPRSVVGGRYMLGSGTSQAAAFVSGAAALILDRNPEATPDQVKELLMAGAGGRFRKVPENCTGAGLPDLSSVVSRIDKRGLPRAAQDNFPTIGWGSLEWSRGSDHVELDGVALEGEQDIFGNPWDAWSWSAASSAGTSWSGGDWNGTSWSGTSWSGLSWSGLSWSGTSWSGLSWSGLSWSGLSWSDKTWTGLSWSGLSWSGTSWSGLSWSGRSWSGAGWTDAAAGVRWD